jgi:L,D-transpeptidase YbiS
VKLKQKLLIKESVKSKQAPEGVSRGTQGLVSLKISPLNQQMLVIKDGIPCWEYTISTAAKGLGEEKDSYKTPRGWHIIRAKIGAGAPQNAIFRERRYTGELYLPEYKETLPGRDWILTRILWLSGLEPGFNRLGNVDTMQRYIYIHGTPDDRPVGAPSSRGCIRMQNVDIIELFDIVTPGTRVFIGD